MTKMTTEQAIAYLRKNTMTFFRNEAAAIVTVCDALEAAESRLLEIDGAEVEAYLETGHMGGAVWRSKKGLAGPYVELIPRPARWSKKE